MGHKVFPFYFLRPLQEMSQVMGHLLNEIVIYPFFKKNETISLGTKCLELEIIMQSEIKSVKK